MLEAIKWAIIKRSKKIIREEAYRMIDKGVPQLNEEIREERGVPLNIEEKELKKRLKDIVDEKLEEYMSR